MPPIAARAPTFQHSFSDSDCLSVSLLERLDKPLIPSDLCLSLLFSKVGLFAVQGASLAESTVAPPFFISVPFSGQAGARMML